MQFVMQLYPTPHFVPEGISSSMRDFIFLAFNFKVFHIKFSEKLSPSKKSSYHEQGFSTCMYIYIYIYIYISYKWFVSLYVEKA